ncbi:tetratricopeptide repeat protein [Gemmatimonas sp.]
MSTAARIEELRKKFDENPRRYFAPLANELRKAGELTQAIALCREHLPKQPGHMSGYIVFGQALYESAELDESRVVFEQALALDPENLIALHHLGHIAKQQGDTASARRWYERALETDPRNDDIAQQLAMLATPVRPQLSVPTPSAAQVAVPSLADNAPPPVDLDGELAFLESGPLSPRRELGAIPTPPIAQEAIGAIPLAPTPDASMRAVDFDVVNESLQNPTSQAFFDIEAIESVGRAIAGDETAAVPPDVALASEPPLAEVGEMAHEPIDLSFDEADDSSLAVEDPFAFVNAEPPADAVATAAPEDLEAAFEEGLVTAGWPAAADFASRAPTPRDLTPISVEVTAEVADAFGRGPLDPVQASLPEPEPDIEDVAPILEVSESLEPEAVAGPVASDEEFDVLSEESFVNAPSTNEDLPWLSDNGVATSAEAVEYAEADEHVEAVEYFKSDELVEAAENIEAVDQQVEFDGPEDAETADAAEPPAFVTETMGELLVAQGFIDRAISVYEELVRRRPYDPVLSARLDELRGLAGAAEPVHVVTARERYAELASRRVARRTPARAATPIGTPVIASAAIATPAVPFPAVPTPALSLPAMSTPAPAGTAAMPTPAESLSALFGGESPSTDDFAAQALADAFAPVPIDSPADSAFDTHFFGNRDSSREPTPAYGTVRQPTPALVVPSVPTPAGDFSFDRFFPDPATNLPAAAKGTPASTPAVPPAAAPTVGEGSADAATGTSDDLAQFSAWLKGLGNS